MPVEDACLRFEATVLPHLDAAYNLARWLTASTADAEDVVQEACLRAWKFFSSHDGPNPRAWLLAIVRNTCRTWLEHNRPRAMHHPLAAEDFFADVREDSNPEASLLRQADRELVLQAIEQLPLECREIVVLRELEGLAYKEISQVIDVPMGTVMSRLARARKRLEQELARRMELPRMFESAVVVKGPQS